MINCIDRIVKAFPDSTITKEELAGIAEALDKISSDPKKTIGEKQAQQKRLLDEGKFFIANRLNNEIKDAIKHNNIVDETFNKRFKSPKHALLSFFEGAEANQLSLENLKEANLGKMLLFDKRLRDLGLSEAAYSGVYDREIYKTVFSKEKNIGPDKDIINGISEVVMQTNEAERLMLNNAGASIGKDVNFVAHVKHNGERIASSSFEEWADKLLKHLNMEKTFGHLKDTNGNVTAEVILKELKKDYNRFVARHDSVRGYSLDSEEFVNHFKTGIPLVDKLNKSRSYHWNSGADMHDYLLEFGPEKNLLSHLTDSYKDSSAKAAQIQIFGTSASKNVEQIVETTAKAHNMSLTEKDTLLRDMKNALIISQDRHIYGGDSNALATTARILRTAQTLSKLGKAAVTSLLDIVPTIMHVRAATGDNLITSSMRTVGTFFSSIPKGSRKKVADELLLQTDSFMRQLRMRTLGADYRPGRSSRMVDALFKGTGLEYLTEVGKSANAELALKDLQNIVTRKSLTREGKNTLNRFRFTTNEIEVLKTLAKEDTLNPRYILEELKNEKLYQKVHAVINSRINQGIPTPGARTHRQLGLYNPKGTVKGETARFFAQFKTTVWKMTTDLDFIARSTSENGEFFNKKSATNLASFLAGSVALGMMINHVKRITLSSEGLDIPEFEMDEDTVANALAAGGGLGIFGDLVAPTMIKDQTLGGDRANIFQSLAGPVAAEGIRGLDAIRSMDEDKLSKFIVGNIPFQNAWFLMNLNKELATTLADITD